jgi:hypothetical protein
MINQQQRTETLDARIDQMSSQLRIDELESALHRVWHIAQHGPVAQDSEQALGRIQRECTRALGRSPQSEARKGGA